jgi:hypothetical protein
MAKQPAPNSDLLPQGFLFSAVKAGIKASGKLDLAVAVAPAGANAAVMFTSNQVVAAPITVGRAHMLATSGPRPRCNSECGQRELRHRQQRHRRLRVQLHRRRRNL